MQWHAMVVRMRAGDERRPEELRRRSILFRYTEASRSDALKLSYFRNAAPLFKHQPAMLKFPDLRWL